MQSYNRFGRLRVQKIRLTVLEGGNRLGISGKHDEIFLNFSRNECFLPQHRLSEAPVVILSFELIPGSAIRASAVPVRMAGRPEKSRRERSQSCGVSERQCLSAASSAAQPQRGRPRRGAFLRAPWSFGSFRPVKRTDALLWKHVQDPCSVAGRRVLLFFTIAV